MNLQFKVPFKCVFVCEKSLLMSVYFLIKQKTGDFIQGKCVVKAIVHPKTEIVYCLLSILFEICIT